MRNLREIQTFAQVRGCGVSTDMGSYRQNRMECFDRDFSILGDLHTLEKLALIPNPESPTLIPDVAYGGNQTPLPAVSGRWHYGFA